MATTYQKSAYQQKLLDPRWQRKRLEILNRASFKCEMCGSDSDTLHVHHGYYERGLDPWEYESDTLHCLCAGCHDMAQDRLRDLHREIALIGPGVYESLIVTAIHNVWRVKFFGGKDGVLAGMDLLALLLFNDAVGDRDSDGIGDAERLVNEIASSFESWKEYAVRHRQPKEDSQG